MVGKSQAPMFHGEKPVQTKLAPNWSLEQVARHAIDFWLSTEDLPMPENRVRVDGEGKLTLVYTPTNDTPKKSSSSSCTRCSASCVLSRTASSTALRT